MSIEKNKNYKKEESQRQKEKQQKAAMNTPAPVEERKPLTGPVEEPANESEKKVFDVLNAMGIPHVSIVKECELRQLSIMSLPRQWRMSFSSVTALSVFLLRICS